jgi:tRNA 2-thiouridine synthesizing protein E
MPLHTQETSIQETILPSLKDPRFPWAPVDWSTADAERCAQKEGVSLVDDHWKAITILQECLTCETHSPRKRDLHDVLDEEFHPKGGLRYLYGLFPGGPIAQGCRMAGLTPPAGSVDRSFGSVQ